jgi:uncharacterized membrane protein
MNVIIWALQGITALVFMFSGINKSIYSEKTIVAKGQTGVENLPLLLIRLIGITEILGAMGIILPTLLNIYPNLTSLSVICLGLVMIPVAIIHDKRNEFKTVLINIAIFIACLTITYFGND